MTRREALAGLAALTAAQTLPARAAAAAAPAAAGSLQAGERVPVLHVTALDGVPHQLDWPKGQSTVLMFFLPSCSACHSMFPRWNQAFQRKPASLAVAGVALELEPPGFFGAYSLTFPVYRGPGVAPVDAQRRREFSEAFKIRQVPTTMRIGPGGVVEDIAVGPTDLMKLGEIFRA